MDIYLGFEGGPPYFNTEVLDINSLYFAYAWCIGGNSGNFALSGFARHYFRNLDWFLIALS